MAATMKVHGMHRDADALEKGSYSPELRDCDLYCISRGIRIRVTLAEDTSPCICDASAFRSSVNS
jgi:hypothetical protein